MMFGDFLDYRRLANRLLSIADGAVTNDTSAFWCDMIRQLLAVIKDKILRYTPLLVPDYITQEQRDAAIDEIVDSIIVLHEYRDLMSDTVLTKVKDGLYIAIRHCTIILGAEEVKE